MTAPTLDDRIQSVFGPVADTLSGFVFVEVPLPGGLSAPLIVLWLAAAACLFSAVFDASIPQSRVDAFCDSLQLFRLGWSWAGPISLCAPYDMASIRTRAWPHTGGLVRFAVGLESVHDLRADLAQALGALQA